MSRGGVGAVSIVLVFTVLCLVIFTVISIVPALTEESLVASEVALITAFYEADTQAERVFARLLAADDVPKNILGTDISSVWDDDGGGHRVSFTIGIYGSFVLLVEAVLGDGFYEILSWRKHNTQVWEADDTLDLWQG